MQKAHGKIKTCIEVMYSLAFNPLVGIIYEGVLCINSYILTYIISPMVLKGKLRYYMLKVVKLGLQLMCLSTKLLKFLSILFVFDTCQREI